MPGGINDNMPSIHAKLLEPGLDSGNVVFVVYPDIVLLDLVGPLQVFTHAGAGGGQEAAYRTHVVSVAGGKVRTNTIVSIDSDPIPPWLESDAEASIHTLVVVGDDGAVVAARDPDFVEQVRELAQRSKRVCSVCSGALIIAAAGLLNGRRAVTHWEDCERLAADNPRVMVEVDPIYVKDGDVWTSAGITAGIDMALAIVEEDLGTAAAIRMARSLVTPMVRAGGQSQFSPHLDRQARDADGEFSYLHVWLNDNLRNSISVEAMAERCGMSPRNFSRRYTRTMGKPPAKAVEIMRIEAARSHLERGTDSVKVIASACGFGDEERMRRAFVRHLGTSPSSYRMQFQTQRTGARVGEVGTAL